MIAFFSSAALLTYTIYSLRAGFPRFGRPEISGLDTQGFLLALVAIVAASAVFGPVLGVSLALAVALHELGHVVAYRLIGHADARFRLIPLIGGYTISNRPPATQAEDFFISLMGPGLCLAPMALAYALSDMSHDTAPLLSDALLTFAIATGALNFLNLLPFWPLDGGHCIRILMNTFAPRLAPASTIAMSAAFAIGALWTKSLMLFLFALIGAKSIIAANETANIQRPMTLRCALLAGAAYLATAVAHLFAGFWFLMGLL
jgi:Zn-dependent protease